MLNETLQMSQLKVDNHVTDVVVMGCMVYVTK